MDEPGFSSGGFLSASRVAIWGLGLMGGSLALALKGKCACLLGIDPDPATVALAREQGIVERADTRPEELLPGADLIVLAAPARAIISQLAQLPALHPGPAQVLDLGSTKARIVAAMAGLPERFDPVGGHPMCGKEKSSLRYAEAAIYQNAPFALVALERSTPRARALAEEVARAAGACPLWIEAGQHDRMVAATSHTPYLVSSALALGTPPEARALVGSGFRSTARLAGSSPRMMADILATNRDHVRDALRRVREQVERYESALEAEDWDALAGLMEEGRERYLGLV